MTEEEKYYSGDVRIALHNLICLSEYIPQNMYKYYEEQIKTLEKNIKVLERKNKK